MTSSSAAAGVHALIFQIDISGLPITARSIWMIMESDICQHETSLKIKILLQKERLILKLLKVKRSSSMFALFSTLPFYLSFF
jgi:hypothetical protein